MLLKCICMALMSEGQGSLGHVPGPLIPLGSGKVMETGWKVVAVRLKSGAFKSRKASEGFLQLSALVFLTSLHG